MPSEHRLERRARLLAETMADATDRLAAQMGEHERPPFTTALTRAESLAWWRQHRHDDFGAKVLTRFTPAQIADLDLALAREMNPEPLVPTQVTTPTEEQMPIPEVA